MGANETTQTVDDPRHAAPKESVPLNNEQRIQTIPYGFFQLLLLENRDGTQNVFSVIKLPKIERLNWE